MPNVVKGAENLIARDSSAMAEIEHLNKRLSEHFADKFVVQSSLTRPLVSFQANKTRPFYRWYKFKEAFSASLVEHLLHKYGITKGVILDPFAGIGTALFAASEMGIDADGIELLPIGQEVIATRKILESEFTPEDFKRVQRLSELRFWEQSKTKMPLPELRITKGAYPKETRAAIEKYLAAYRQENKRVQTFLRFALLCVLESVSFTRKDGQYLRWDCRSGRCLGKKVFDKGAILTFEEAICEKINEIVTDLRAGRHIFLFPSEKPRGVIRLCNGSCLGVLPGLPDISYDAIITSPPYCNRYDYTRTYALELALLGIDEQGLLRLRQEMLSCTVENRAKDLLRINPSWTSAISAADQQELLQAILLYLDDKRSRGILNNAGIPRMVRGYFYEMACVVMECSRVLKSDALLLMVNDNVRYAGASVSVDMILSDFAERLGFRVENILVLPSDKGNSSQQMGEHGREALRKCVYVWRKL